MYVKYTKNKRRILTFSVLVMALALPMTYTACSGFSAAQMASLGASSAGGIDTSGMGYSESPVAKTCSAALRGTSELGVRRLTKPEIVASLTLIFGSTIVNDSRVQSVLPQIPDQTSNAAAFDNSITDVQGMETVADALVTVTFGSSANVNSVLGGCTDTTTAAGLATCTNSLVSVFGLRAFRRPLPADSETSVRNLVSTIGGVDGLKNGMTRILISPFFTQKIEMGVNADVTNAATVDVNAPLQLTPYEVASRLSFALIGSGPDQTLLDAAKANQLTTVDQVKAQATRLLGLTQAHTNFRRMVNAWLNLGNGTNPDQNAAANFGVSADGLGAEAVNEVLDYAEYEAFTKKNTYLGFMTDQMAVASTDRLAKIFGVTKSSTAQAINNGLGGILLRPGALMSARNGTSPILRGVFIQKSILCTQIPSPDPNLVANFIDSLTGLDHVTLTNREYYTKATSGDACLTCHSIINPVGFTLEGFGPLGEPRTVEKVYDSNNALQASHPINTSVDDVKLYTNHALPEPDATSMLQAIAKSGRAQQCFEAKLIQNSNYRAVDSTDGCTINEMDALQASNKTILDTLVQNVANAGIFYKSAKGLQ